MYMKETKKMIYYFSEFMLSYHKSRIPVTLYSITNSSSLLNQVRNSLFLSDHLTRHQQVLCAMSPSAWMSLDSCYLTSFAWASKLTRSWVGKRKNKTFKRASRLGNCEWPTQEVILSTDEKEPDETTTTLNKIIGAFWELW